MSDRPPEEGSDFASYWLWLLREKLGEDKFRLIRSTPGIPDRTNMVENVEKAATEFALARVDQLRSMIDGWELTVKGMSYEVACHVFNEFVSGCRTLEDFETRNFSKKDNDPNVRPRDAFPPTLSAKPMFTRDRIQALAEQGALPTTGMIYSPHTREFFDPETTMLYLARVFGTPEIYDRILQGSSKTPNMPAPKNHAMPYHPQMDQEKAMKQFETMPQVTAPFTSLNAQQPPQYQQQYQQEHTPNYSQQMEQQQQAHQQPQNQQQQQAHQQPQNQQQQQPQHQQNQHQQQQHQQLKEHPQQQPQQQIHVQPQQQAQMQPQSYPQPHQQPMQLGMEYSQPQPTPMQYPYAYNGHHPMMVPQQMHHHVPMGMQIITLPPGMAMPPGMGMQHIPMHPMGMPDNHFVGQPFQQGYMPPNQQQGPQDYPQMQYRGGYQQFKRSKRGRYEPLQRIPTGYENVTNSSTSSSGTVQQTRSTGSDEEAPFTKSEAAMKEAFPTLNGQETSASLEIDVAAPQTVSGGTKAVVTTPRKFSDVVSHSATAPSTTPGIATVQEELSPSKTEPAVLEEFKPITVSVDLVVTEKTVKSVEPAKPVEHAEPADVAKSAAPVKPANQIQPASPAKSVVPVKPTEPAERANCEVTSKPAEIVKPASRDTPSELAKPVQPVKTAAPVKPANVAKPSSPVKLAQAPKPDQSGKPAKSAKSAIPAKPAAKNEPEVVSTNNFPVAKPTISESSTTTKDTPVTSKPSPQVKSNTCPATSDSGKSKENGTSAVSSTTSALRVETSYEKVSAASPTSTRTVAEIVQQNLSATPSPAPKHVTSAQSSPAFKPTTETSTVLPDGLKDSSRGKPMQAQQNKKVKRDQLPPKPSISYAQMLYPKEKEKKREESVPSTASSISGQSSSSQSQNAAAPTDWHTVKNKKAAEPAIVSSQATEQPFPALPGSQNGHKTTKTAEPVDEGDNDDGINEDDSEAEKKRAKRRNQRQKMKEANRQQKQVQKEAARQESLARVEKMNGANSSQVTETKPEEPVKPAFDRNDLAARRKKRLELQRKSEMPAEQTPQQPTTGAITRTVQSTPTPMFSLIPGGIGANSMNASIAAGHSAMGAYGLMNHQTRSPFSITKNGTNQLPLYLPKQPGLRTNQDGLPGGVVIEQDPSSSTPTYIPISVRQISPEEPTSEKNDGSVPGTSQVKKNVAIDPAAMIDQILKFDKDNILPSCPQ